MNNHTIILKSVDELCKDRYFIPTYQRGYRWNQQQVEDLLNDIWEFTQKNPQKDEIYCLQPVVVKKYEDRWEVIDGQQRLTTIQIILNYCFQQMNRPSNIYSIEYASRPQSELFLQQIDGEEKEKNVDFYHMWIALESVNKWFNKHDDSLTAITTIYPALRLKTKVIWYEIEDTPDLDPKEIFTRLNIGKISLTDAELIKALFLKAENFTLDDDPDKDQRRSKLKQLEIASEWDRMEYALQNDSFWYFLTKIVPGNGPRISFLFDLMASNSGNEHDYFTFHTFYDLFIDPKSGENLYQKTTNLWKKVKEFFMTLDEWYNDRVLYHLVGYLLAAWAEGKYQKKEPPIVILHRKSTKSSKGDFIQFLKDEIKGIVNCDLDTLTYNDKYLVRHVLLLFNVQSILNNGDANSKFSFDRYKTEEWNIEHIHAVKSKMPDTINRQKDWLNVLISEMGSHLSTLFVTRATAFIDGVESSEDSFETLYNDILVHYGARDGNEINGIGNLTLLDASTNKSYKNAIFPIKRKKIITRDETGTFIPLCTKNVFLKHYIDDPEQLTVWSLSDCRSYKAKIENTLTAFLD